jgi:hypothetical protein
MIFNPISNSLFTDESVFLKKLYCPYDIQWDDLENLEDSSNKSCNICSKKIFDTKNLSEDEVKALIENDESVCLKLDMNQNNIRINTHV